MARPQKLPIYAKDKPEYPLPTDNGEQIQKEGFKQGDFPQDSDFNPYFQLAYMWLKWLAPLRIEDKLLKKTFYSYFDVDNFPFTSGAGSSISVIDRSTNKVTNLNYRGEYASTPVGFVQNDCYFDTTLNQLRVYLGGSFTNFDENAFLPSLDSYSNKKLNEALQFLRDEVSAINYVDYDSQSSTGDSEYYPDIENPNIDDELNKKISVALEEQIGWLDQNQKKEIESRYNAIDVEGKVEASPTEFAYIGSESPYLKKLSLEYNSITIKQNGVTYDDTKEFALRQDGFPVFNKVGNVCHVDIPGGSVSLTGEDLPDAEDRGGITVDLDFGFTLPNFLKPYRYGDAVFGSRIFNAGLLKSRVTNGASDTLYTAVREFVFPVYFQYNDADSSFKLRLAKPNMFSREFNDVFKAYYYPNKNITNVLNQDIPNVAPEGSDFSNYGMDIYLNPTSTDVTTVLFLSNINFNYLCDPNNEDYYKTTKYANRNGYIS